MPPSNRFLIAVDYGTTYTGVAWVLTEGREATLDDVNLVVEFGNLEPKIPSTITYSPNEGSQWGTGIGQGAYVLRWTKLQLEPPSRLEALKRLKHTLEEARLLAFDASTSPDSVPIPHHLVCTTEHIVTDYLTYVAEAVYKDIGEKKDALTRDEFVIDLMITHPSKWDKRAKNITFRAVNEAFRRAFPRMRDVPGTIRMGTEPEACGHFIMSSALQSGLSGLKRGQCFVVVDAGGGTVDLVSYQVDQPLPNFKVARITEPTGGPYGSTRVDQHFLKRFLPERLSEADYDRLMNFDRRSERHGSGPHAIFTSKQHILLERFQVIKHAFAGVPREDFLRLPNEVGVGEDGNDNPLRGDVRKHVRITSDDLAAMFEEPVSGIQTLILEQLTQIRQRKKLPAHAVFLSGGFSLSPYLLKVVKSLCDRRRILLLRSEQRTDNADLDLTAERFRQTGWPDVVKGAALMGLGIGCTAPPVCFECPFHIGVLIAVEFKEHEHQENQAYIDMFDRRRRARNHIEWIAAKGDLITHDEPFEKTIKIMRKTTENARLTGSISVIVSDEERDLSGEIPSKSYQIWPLDYDLEAIDARDWSPFLKRVIGQNHCTLELSLEASLNFTRARFELTCGRTVDLQGNVGAPGYQLAHVEKLWSEV